MNGTLLKGGIIAQNSKTKKGEKKTKNMETHEGAQWVHRVQLHRSWFICSSFCGIKCEQWKCTRRRRSTVTHIWASRIAFLSHACRPTCPTGGDGGGLTGDKAAESVTKADVFKDDSVHFQLCLWRPKLVFYVRPRCHSTWTECTEKSSCNSSVVLSWFSFLAQSLCS